MIPALSTGPGFCAKNPLLTRGWTGQSPGRVWGGTGSDLVPPLIRRCGGTFPQGKVGVPLVRGIMISVCRKGHLIRLGFAEPPSPEGKASSGGEETKIFSDSPKNAYENL